MIVATALECFAKNLTPIMIEFLSQLDKERYGWQEISDSLKKEIAEKAREAEEANNKCGFLSQIL